LGLTVTLVALLAACGSGNPAGTPGGTPGGGNGGTDGGAPTPYTMSGVVRNSAGEPLEGAGVFAGHTVYYNTNALGVTDAQGRYRVSVREPAGSWHAGAQIKRSYNGQSYTFDLQPDNTEPFQGSQGAIRNFNWRLTGDRPGGGKYGATLTVYADFFDPELLDWLEDIELTLTPSGPLVGRQRWPGRAGKAASDARGGRSGGHRPRALHHHGGPRPGGRPPQAMKIRVRNSGEFGRSVTANFKQNGSGHLLEVEVSRR
jgi:hypothetical protein